MAEFQRGLVRIPGSANVTDLNIIPSPAWTNVFFCLRSP